jgi:hypothetical protein
MGKKEPTYWQARLIEGGYSEVTLELTVHLGGPEVMVLIGVGLSETASREPISLEAFDTVEKVVGARQTADRIYSVVCKALAALQPFP